ncbi:Nn.00g041170.m01.CDS01 [Neocucurbitaria sp. VM-36]
MTSTLLGIVRDKEERTDFGLQEVKSENWTFVMAGADSTSIGLRSVFYFLMKNSETLNKAKTKFNAAFADGTLSARTNSFRLYAPFAATLQRYSPKPQIIVLAGTHVPSGARVGLSSAVVHHNKGVFGEDAAYLPAEALAR